MVTYLSAEVVVAVEFLGRVSVAEEEVLGLEVNIGLFSCMVPTPGTSYRHGYRQEHRDFGDNMAKRGMGAARNCSSEGDSILLPQMP